MSQNPHHAEVVRETVHVEVFDPAMCCSTGVCGPSVDPKLARFAADLDWLKAQGVSVTRYNLAQSPAAFAASAPVKSLLEKLGVEGLPIVLVNGSVASTAAYPTRQQLAGWGRVEAPKVAGLPRLGIADVVLTGVAPKGTGGGCCAPPSGCC